MCGVQGLQPSYALAEQDIGDVVIGSVLGDSSQRAIQCRVASLLSGIPETVPVHTVNRCVTNGRCYLPSCPGEWSACRLRLAPVEHVGACRDLCKRAQCFWLCACIVRACWAAVRTEQVSCAACRQCSSGLQAVASVAASIRAGFYTIGLAGGVETMSTNPMAWNGGVNPKLDQNQQAADCLLPMGAQCLPRLHMGLLVLCHGLAQKATRCLF